MTCWVQWVVLSLALFSPTPELKIFLVGAVLSKLVSSLPSRIACGVESPAAEVKLPGLARFYLFRCICNLFYFCKTWICMSTIVVCVPWLVLDRDLMHIQLRNSGSRISGRDKLVSEPTLTVGQAKWKPKSPLNPFHCICSLQLDLFRENWDLFLWFKGKILVARLSEICQNESV